MLLSDAIKFGSSLRPESHQDRFCYVHGRGWCSDVYGAACEAVWPNVAKLNWDNKDRVKFESSMETFRAVQLKYFGHYQRMEAVCPGARQTVMAMGGRIVGQKNGDPQIKVYERGATVDNLGGVTSECDRVTNMFAMADHLFYAHGWTREAVAEAVAWYEQTAANTALIRNFAHYRVN
jgi:hypothetical protein